MSQTRFNQLTLFFCWEVIFWQTKLVRARFETTGLEAPI